MATFETNREEGIPIVRLNAEFIAPGSLGDDVDSALEVAQLCKISAGLLAKAICDGKQVSDADA